MIDNFFNKYVSKILKESPDGVMSDNRFISYDAIFSSDAHTGILMDNNPTDFIVSNGDLKMIKDIRISVGHSGFIEALNNEFSIIEPHIKTNLSVSSLKLIADGMSKDMIHDALRFRIFKTKPQKYISAWPAVSESIYKGLKNACSALKYDVNDMRWDVSLFMDADDVTSMPDDLYSTIASIRPKKTYIDGDQPYYVSEQLDKFFEDSKQIPEIIKKFEEKEEQKREEQRRLEKEVKLRSLGFPGKKKNYWET